MKLNRRFLLRGMINGTAAAVALPFLDCFLDSKGKALAATGENIPTRFGTYFWGCGLTKQMWVPKTTGKNWEITPQLKPLESIKDKINVFSNFRIPFDDNPNYQHWSGVAAAATGISPTKNGQFDSETIDQQIAGVISRGARYKSIAASAAGNAKESYSSLGGLNTLPAEPSPLSLYTRLFGPGFQDPSSPDWKPDPKIMLQKSVLSVVADDRKRAMMHLGAADKSRMDQYFTSLRELEIQMNTQLVRPKLTAKVQIPEAPAHDIPVNNSLSNIKTILPMMAKFAAIAYATDQTRVFNISVSEPASQIFVPGDSLGYHQSTHEEPIDPVLGYQIRVHEYNVESMKLFALFLNELNNVREGDGTLLDNSLTFAFTDQSYAKIHAVDGLPMFTAGNAGGKMKSGYHIDGNNSPVSRVGLTIHRAMNTGIDTWGINSMETKNQFSELLA